MTILIAAAAIGLAYTARSFARARHTINNARFDLHADQALNLAHDNLEAEYERLCAGELR